MADSVILVKDTSLVAITGAVVAGAWSWLKGRHTQLNKNTEAIREVKSEVCGMREQLEKTTALAEKSIEQNHEALGGQKEMLDMIARLVTRNKEKDQDG